ncbi:MAG: hypothetical protein DSY84_05055, partial [Candidatus Neomarinimicrobiota bacterium]
MVGCGGLGASTQRPRALSFPACLPRGSSCRTVLHLRRGALPPAATLSFASAPALAAAPAVARAAP